MLCVAVVKFEPSNVSESSLLKLLLLLHAERCLFHICCNAMRSSLYDTPVLLQEPDYDYPAEP